MTRRIALLATVVTLASTALAGIFGSVRGIVHDPQHRPISRSHGDAEGEIVRLDEKCDH